MFMSATTSLVSTCEIYELRGWLKKLKIILRMVFWIDWVVPKKTIPYPQRKFLSSGKGGNCLKNVLNLSGEGEGGYC